MGNRIKIVFGIIVLVVILVLIYFKPEVGLNNNDNNNQLTHIDTTKILIADKMFLLKLEENNRNEISAIRNSYKDSLVNEKELIKLLKQNLKNNLTLIDSIHHLKNNELFPFKVEFYKLKNKQPNIWVILLIVLVSGILGGFARTKYSLLEDLVKGLEKIEEKNNVIKKSIGLLESQNSIQTDELNEEVNSLKSKIENIKNEDNEKTFVNIIFGIIASSLSFLALTTFNSKVLDFQSEIDYFIFLGWCLLGAVFAKNWIKSLYSRITTINT